MPRPRMSSENIIRIENLDDPIHRIFPLWFLEDTLRHRHLVLVAPRLWEDPLEIVGDVIGVQWREDGLLKHRFINEDLPPAYAQCWSASPESDTLLRAYSRVVKDPRFGRNLTPRDEGVRVRSTPRKLLEAASAVPSPRGYQAFIGAVKYLDKEHLLQELANAIERIGLKVFHHPPNRAKLLLLKRQQFAHEAEIRLIIVGKYPQSSDEIARVDIEPSAVFEEIAFDPRLNATERHDREAMVRALGYQGPFHTSDLYQRVLLQVGLEHPPSDL